MTSGKDNGRSQFSADDKQKDNGRSSEMRKFA
jgi:hypothetical protein